MSTDGEGPDVDAESQRVIYPGTLPGQAGDDEESNDLRIELVPFHSMSAADARELCARLESEGLPCEIKNQTSDESQVIVLVREEDFDVVREILHRPAEPEDDDSDDEEKDRVELCEKNWICPKCAVRPLHVLPVSAGWAWFRLCFTAILVLPFVVMFLQWLLPLRFFTEITNSVPDWWFSVWVCLLITFGISFVVTPRKKHCLKCGWESGMNGGRSNPAVENQK